jgi:hypothetical protein
MSDDVVGKLVSVRKVAANILFDDFIYEELGFARPKNNSPTTSSLLRSFLIQRVGSASHCPELSSSYS